MKTMTCGLFRILGLSMVMAFSAPVVRAVPYASCVTNRSGTISFLLNENADDVKVLFNSNSVTNALGALTKGSNGFSLASYTNFQICVSSAAALSWTRTSDTNNVLCQFPYPRGLAVNITPTNSSLFGRIYVANAVNASTSVTGSRSTGEGIFILGADQSDVLGRGNAGSTAGITFDSGTASSAGADSPFRIELDRLGNLFITDYSTNTGTIWRTDPDVNTSSQVLAGLGLTGNATVHTTIGSIAVKGQLENGNLVVYGHDGNISPYNIIMRWTINSGPLPWATAPSKLTSAGRLGVAHLIMDLDFNPDFSKMYETINRSLGTDTGSLRMENSSGTVQWDSLTVGGSPDPLRTIHACKVAPDGTRIALARDDNRIILVALTNGIASSNSFPNLASTNMITSLPVSPTATRGDVSWDAAGNLYLVSPGVEVLAVLSPGGTNVAVTGGDASGLNGTFFVVSPPRSVSGNAGTTIAISAIGSSQMPAAYQWKFNGANISGQTTNILFRTNIQTATLAGAYQLQVSNASGIYLTPPASLTIVEGPVAITAQSASLTNNAGTSAAFSVTTVGSDTRLFQWQQNGTNIPGATASSYTRANVQQSDVGSYHCLVSNPYNSVTSTDVTLTVNDTAPLFTTSLVDKTNSPGTNITFTVATTGTDPRSYQWNYNGTDIPNATNTTLTLTNVQTSNAGTYTVTVSNSVGSTNSTSVLTVNDTPTPVFVTQPKGATNGTGVNMTFSTVAIGNNIRFQWYTNSTAAANQTNTSFTWIDPQLADNNSSIYVTIENDSTSPLSSSTVLMGVTNKAPTIITQPTNFAGVANGTAYTSVAAQGNEPLTYQWYLNTSNTVSGATDAILTLNNVQQSQVGNYSVVITGGGLSTTSSVALLAVSNNVSPINGTGTGVTGQYVANTFFNTTAGSILPTAPFSFTNTPAVTRLDTNIDFLWSTSSPDPAVSNPDFFLARWSGQVQPRYSEDYTFYTKSDDGVRLWINGQLVIDKFVSGGNQNYTAVISNMVANQKYDLRMEYCENTGAAEAHLFWSSTSQFKEVVPTSQLYPTTRPFVINIQPTNAVVTPGGAASFTAVVGGSPTSYQWQHNGSNVPGANAATLSLSNLQIADAGSYNLVVSNSSGAVTSPAPAMVYVQIASTPGTGNGVAAEYYSNMAQTTNAPISLTGPPAVTRIETNIDFIWGTGSPDNVNVSNDKFVARWSGQIQPLYSQVYTFFTRTDDGVRLYVDGNLLIDQWVNQSPTEWAGTMPYAFTAGQKYNFVMEYFDNASTAEAHLSWASDSQAKGIIPATQLYNTNGVTITSQPAGVTNQAGNTVNFSVAAAGSPTITYQWRKGSTGLSNGGRISGATSANLTIGSIVSGDAGSYNCVVANGYGSVTSATALLGVITGVAPSITTQPLDTIVDQGRNTNLTVVASGTAPLYYQWAFNNNPIGGATNSSLVLTNVQPSAGGPYKVTITNSIGSVTSTNAALTVRPIMSAGINGNQLTITWSGSFTLQTSTNAEGPYVDIVTSSPYTVDVTSGPRRFYRMRQ